MNAGVMDPNVSAAVEAHDIFEGLPQIVSDADMGRMASMLTDDEQSMLTDEQAMLTDEQRSIITSLEHSMLTDDDDDDDSVDKCTRSPVSKHADSSPTPQDPADRGPQNNILNPIVKDRNYTKFTPEEVDKLIRAVDQHGRRWIIIKREYFIGSTRTTQQLKDKWRHMLDTVTTDLKWTELYAEAKKVDAIFQQDGRSSRFRNTNND